MKFQLIILGTALALFCSCEKDNYEAPDATFEGRLVYNGDPVNVEYNQVHFQLWEPGWGALTPIDVLIKPDGGFSALLFNGDYKLVFPGGQGPFLTGMAAGADSDTIHVDLNGSRQMDIEVLPWYMVRDADFSIHERTVSASCRLEKIITGADERAVERVTLYINKTQFVSGANNIASAGLGGGDISDMNNISLSADVPDLVREQDHVFARIGVKIAGVEDMIFSTVQKIQL